MTLPDPDIRLETTTPPENVHAALELAHAGIVELPAELVELITTAGVLLEAAEHQAAHHRALAAVSPEVRARELIVAQARAGGQLEAIADAAASAGRHRAETAAALAQYELLRGAAGSLGAQAVTRTAERAPQLVEQLATVLEALRAEALEDAEAVTAASIDYTDPAALLGAGPGIRSAFERLAKRATRHDLILRAVVALYGARRSWDGIEAFSGYGVEQYVPSPGVIGWRWHPAGHAVERLCHAALDTADELEAMAV